MVPRGIFIILYCILLFNSIPAQNYKSWFIDPADCGCKSCVVGIAYRSYLDTSAIKCAFNDACIKFVRYKNSKVSGVQVFLNTGYGMIAMGDTLAIIYDTSSIEETKRHLKILDTLKTKNIVAVIVSDNCSDISSSSKEILSDSTQKPYWADSIPYDKEFYYSLGISEHYYYETSSWNMAEEKAFVDLAKQTETKSCSLTKVSGTYEEVQNNSYSAVLPDVKVAGRWKDNLNNIYYVLLKMPK